MSSDSVCDCLSWLLGKVSVVLFSHSAHTSTHTTITSALSLCHMPSHFNTSFLTRDASSVQWLRVSVQCEW